MAEAIQTIKKTARFQKIYNCNAVRVGAFIGGPIAAGYLIAENFKAFGEVEKVKRTWFFAIVATFIIIAGVFYIPDSVIFPKIFIPLVYSFVAFYITKSTQDPYIKEHLSIGRPFFTLGRIIFVGLVGAALTFALIIVFSSLSGKAITAI